ncbi:hypothetical protein F5Y06DRAFT_256479 [Hypoxylon sp. FL0890]|nr:hypothetical protein F5Y06DRAFT_256479 [Hypoxylon sp. FL0890]
MATTCITTDTAGDFPIVGRRAGRVQHRISCASCQLFLEKDVFNSNVEQWILNTHEKVNAQDDFWKISAGMNKRFLWGQMAKVGENRKDTKFCLPI